jgi:hypothetical protein
MTQPISGTSFLIRKKILKLFGSDFRVFDSQKNEILFAHLKAFKLKEDITLYTNESKTQGVINIKARSIIDFSAAYDFYDMTTGMKIGAAKRKGFKSLVRDEWIILNQNDEEIGLLQEDSGLMAIVRRLITSLIPQKFTVNMGNTEVCRYENNFNPFVSKVSIHIFKPENYPPLFAIAMGVLLCAIEGKQG